MSQISIVETFPINGRSSFLHKHLSKLTIYYSYLDRQKCHDDDVDGA